MNTIKIPSLTFIGYLCKIHWLSLNARHGELPVVPSRPTTDYFSSPIFIKSTISYVGKKIRAADLNLCLGQLFIRLCVQKEVRQMRLVLYKNKAKYL